METHTTAGWWTTFFDSTYATVGFEQTNAEAVAHRELVADRIVTKLGLSAGDTIFDQCCGVGRLSIPLAKRGLRVIGVDQAASYTETAQKRADALQLDTSFHAGDAFEFVTPRPCDGAINWFTSFGYHRDDRINARMLQRAHESLRSGGRFALDYISVPKVLAQYKECQVGRPRLPDGSELWLIQEASIDFRAGMMIGDWTFLHPDGTRERRRVENRAYLPHELVRMFEAAGFVDIDLTDADGSPYVRTSLRLVVLGRKP